MHSHRQKSRAAASERCTTKYANDGVVNMSGMTNDVQTNSPKSICQSVPFLFYIIDIFTGSSPFMLVSTRLSGLLFQWPY